MRSIQLGWDELDLPTKETPCALLCFLLFSFSFARVYRTFVSLLHLVPSLCVSLLFKSLPLTFLSCQTDRIRVWEREREREEWKSEVALLFRSAPAYPGRMHKMRSFASACHEHLENCIRAMTAWYLVTMSHTEKCHCRCTDHLDNIGSHPITNVPPSIVSFVNWYF